MLIAQHSNARTTPALRTGIAACNEAASVPTQRFGLTGQARSQLGFEARNIVGFFQKQHLPQPLALHGPLN